MKLKHGVDESAYAVYIVTVLYTFTRTVLANSLSSSSSTTKQHRYHQLPLNDDNRWRKELPTSSEDNFHVDLDDYDQYDYGILDRLEDSSTVTVSHLNITCFMCLYINDLNRQQSKEVDTSCLDPFIPDNIPRAQCDGPCAKVYKKLDALGSFILIRTCMPMCQERIRASGNDSFTECCTSSFCNGLSPSDSVRRMARRSPLSQQRGEQPNSGGGGGGVESAGRRPPQYDYEYYEHIRSRRKDSTSKTPANSQTRVDYPVLNNNNNNNNQAMATALTPPNISCFSCLYLNDLNQEQGPSSCLDPFVAENIPVVQCAGPCAKIYRKLESEESFILTRNCMPNCKELMRTTHTGSFTDCCSTNFCNAATRLAAGSSMKTSSLLSAVLHSCNLFAGLVSVLITQLLPCLLSISSLDRTS